MRKRVVRLASTMLMTGGLGLAGLGLAQGSAQAQPGYLPLDDDNGCVPWVPCGWGHSDWWRPGDWQGPQWWGPGQWWQGDQGDNQQ
jgi:hypothetical protein